MKSLVSKQQVNAAVLKLLFVLSAKLCSIDVAQVLEVLPVVPLDAIPGAPEYVAGYLNYHGTKLPVIDLPHLIEGKPAANKLSTRIILIDASNNREAKRPLGLICEGVTDTTRKDMELTTTDLDNVLPRSMYDFLFEFAKS